MSQTRFDALTRHRLRTIAEHARHFYNKGWLPATAGNMSVRLPDGIAGSFIVSATGRHKAHVSPDGPGRSWSRRAADGSPVAAGEPAGSSDTAIHAALYRSIPQIGAVYHAHLLDGTAADRLAASKQDSPPDAARTIDVAWCDTIKAFGGWCDWTRGEPLPIAVAPNGDADQTAHWLATWLESPHPGVAPGVNVADHGIYVWGSSPDEARRHLEAFAYLFELHLADHPGAGGRDA